MNFVFPTIQIETLNLEKQHLENELKVLKLDFTETERKRWEQECVKRGTRSTSFAHQSV